MFIGEYSHSIDQKGRMAIPAKMRGKLSDGAVVTKGMDNCLFVYPRIEWEKLAEKLANLPISDNKARAYARSVLAGAMELEFDKLGRVLIPGYLREFANLGNSVTVAGLYNRIEIWNEKAWKEYKLEADNQSDEINDHLASLGI